MASKKSAPAKVKAAAAGRKLSFKHMATKRAERVKGLVQVLLKQCERGELTKQIERLKEVRGNVEMIHGDLLSISDDFAPAGRAAGPSLSVGDKVVILPDAIENFIALFGPSVKATLIVAGVTRGQASLSLKDGNKIALARKFVQKVDE